jgi:uncharacterized FlaG/YvyC family protein
MAENPVSNVNRVEVQSPQAAQPTQVNHVNAQATQETATVQPADQVEKDASSENSPQPQPSPTLLTGRQTNLKFQVDAETNQVTVMIMDKATNKVISTIPPDKINDIPPGDLLRYQV